MQQIAEHKGCGTHGEQRESELRFGSGPERSVSGDLGEGQESSLLQRRGASSLRAHARGGGARLQHSMQLLQPQIRLRQ